MFNYIKSNIALPILGRVVFQFELEDNKDLDTFPLLHIFLIDEDRKLYKEYDGSNLWQGDYVHIHEFINYTGNLKFSYHNSYFLKQTINFTAIFREGELWCIEVDTIQHE